MATVETIEVASKAPAQSGPHVHLFGCRIDALRMPEAAARAYELMAAGEDLCNYVVTPNVDHVVMLEHHQGLRRAYDDADLVLADGMPVVLASRLFGSPLPERVTGADLVPAVFDAAADRGGLRVFLLGAGPGVGEMAAANIAKRWPAVEVCGTYSPPFGFEKDPAENDAILAMIAASCPDALVVGLGAAKQELWVHANREAIRAKTAFCVGATIDFLAGHKRRAPMWMRDNGLEWLHRVATEPRRLLGRYLRDARKFPRLLWREYKRRRALTGKVSANRDSTA